MQRLDYIHQNPVKAGFVRQAEDWLWSSAADYAGIGEQKLELIYLV
jgi:putative transposase